MSTNNRLSWIEYKGIQILVVDYSNLRFDEEILSILKSVFQILENSNEQILMLCDYRNTYISKDIISYSLKNGGIPQKKIKKRAFLGNSFNSLSATLLESYRFAVNGKREAYMPFNEKSNALDWLVED